MFFVKCRASLWEFLIITKKRFNDFDIEQGNVYSNSKYNKNVNNTKQNNVDVLILAFF
jgi:hypothetical protein